MKILNIRRIKMPSIEMTISIEQFEFGKKKGLHVEDFYVEPEFRWQRYEDDPAYDPRSGNSMTCTYRPEYSYEPKDIYVDLGEVKERLALINTDRDAVNVRVEFPHNENYYETYSLETFGSLSGISITKLIECIYGLCSEYIENEVEYDGD
jgi:hypothetical protein